MRCYMLLLLLYTYDFYGLIDVRIFREWHQDVNRSRCPRLKKNCKESLLPRLLSMLHRREDPAGVAPTAMATRIPLMGAPSSSFWTVSPQTSTARVVLLPSFVGQRRLIPPSV
ncbi:hypothetical protein HanPSC8_Chr07g0291801 [Helianthus annuus]|nr:hypothetical protein HanPSC8_Chr07g0291771 [Helianthus annuus]KAJ0905249.1 hypothetical protein HanPSC8_Chr07g0291801 [Helianthus annuus]